MRRFLSCTAAALAAAAPSASGGGEALRAIVEERVPLVEAAGRAARGGARPEAVQAQYDAARDLQEALRRSEPVDTSCRPLLGAARALAAAHVLQVEGYDRPWPPLAKVGVQRARAALTTLAPARSRCRPRPAHTPVRLPEPLAPRSGEAFFGHVSALVPPGTSVATVRLGERRFDLQAPGRRLTWAVPPSVEPGRYDLELEFRSGGARGSLVGRARSAGVWLLPPSARRAVPANSPDRPAAARLEALARQFSGYAGIWTLDLGSGRTAGAGADARFPAASTVKLAVLVAALRRLGSRPERSPAAYDLAALAGWSSNAATNRLLVRLGGSETAGAVIAQGVLDRAGAARSTFTGGYRLGTALARRGTEPPLVSSRVTTARDLGRMLLLLHTAATGDAGSLRALGLSPHQARVGLALLLSWRAPPPGDNAGNFAQALPRSIPAAQKCGWISSARHTAAIVYGPGGPRIVVLLTYRPGIDLAEAQTLGRRVLEALG